MDLALKRPSLTGLNLLQNKSKYPMDISYQKGNFSWLVRMILIGYFFIYLFYTQDSLSSWPGLELSMCAKDS